MQYSIRVRSVAAEALDRSGLVRYALQRRSRNGLLILMYHRILPPEEAQTRVQAGMYVVPETFEEHLGMLKELFQVVPVSEIVSGGRRIRSGRDPRPACVLTFDDGWSDFRRYAYPSLKAHALPATVFLATDFVGTARTFWTDELCRLFYAREAAGSQPPKTGAAVSLPIRLLEAADLPAEGRLEQAIETMKRMSQDEIAGVVVALAQRWGRDDAPRQRDFLTWDEAREMHRSGWVNFGSHTASHRILTMLSDAEVSLELARSRDRLVAEGLADGGCLPFAYPNGDFDARTAELVRKHGYTLAVTTRKGWVPLEGDMDRFELQRIAIHQDMAFTRGMFGCRMLQWI